MIYLDNAATTFPKPENVYTQMDYFARNFCGNPGRGGHKLAFESSVEIAKTRELIAKLFNINNPLHILFTKNATEALNLAIKGFVREGEHVITTSMEHNSVIRPLYNLDKKINLTIIQADKFGQVDTFKIKKAITDKTKLIVATYSSNVNGTILPVDEIGKIAKENNIKFLLDASQGAGSFNIDVKKLNSNMLAAPGHKGLFGPQGTGFLYVDESIKLKPLIQGGTGTNSESIIHPLDFPDGFESGTLNVPGIVGLGAGINYITEIGIKEISKHKTELLNYFYEGLSKIKHVKLYSKKVNNSGIIALNFKDIDSTEVSYVLDKAYNIASRAGMHCSYLAHKTLDTLDVGIVRFSLSYFNSLKEISNVLSALDEISKNMP